MEKLKFCYSAIDEEGVVRLSQSVEKIECLKLEECNLTPRGISSLAAQIKNRSVPVRLVCAFVN